MLITEHATVHYFRTAAEAQAIADRNAADDNGGDDGFKYVVEYHAGRRCYFIAVFDECGERLGTL